mmetsp:Transcript_7130/g.44194  ORF Transcript_7130/g.44194 Transcript_7130/m.44194 type:complete len:121 (-) Transcript_7130:1651-2013(-)
MHAPKLSFSQSSTSGTEAKERMPRTKQSDQMTSKLCPNMGQCQRNQVETLCPLNGKQRGYGTGDVAWRDVAHLPASTTPWVHQLQDSPITTAAFPTSSLHAVRHLHAPGVRSPTFSNTTE